MDDAFFMMFTEAPSARVTGVLSVIDDPSARKRLVITGASGVYGLYLQPQQVDQLVKALK